MTGRAWFIVTARFLGVGLVQRNRPGMGVIIQMMGYAKRRARFIRGSVSGDVCMGVVFRCVSSVLGLRPWRAMFARCSHRRHLIQ